MTKLLWLSNFCFRDTASTISGTWIEAMGKGLVATGQYSIVNVSLSGVKEIRRSEACGIIQWELPYKQLDKTGNPPLKMLNELQNIENDFKPDLIHVWGTERFWGLATARKILKTPALLEMQGIPAAMVPYMTGCLTQDELHACFNLKELIKPFLSLPNYQRRYKKGWVREREIISGHQFIDYESEWVRNYIMPIATRARLFKTRMILRSEFLAAVPWTPPEDDYVVFSSCGCAPNKGLHTLIRAVAMLKRRYPQIRLEVAGSLDVGIRQSGYQRWIMKEIERLGIRDSVKFLGQINSAEMITAFYRSSIVALPSFVESYSMSLAEAMAVGCPCVVSYAGAMPEVGGTDVCYFPIADVGSCAGAIELLLTNKKFAVDMGIRSMKRSRSMHDCCAGVSRQIEIYEQVIGRSL